MNKIANELELIAKQLYSKKSEDTLIRQIQHILDNGSFVKKLSQFYGDDEQQGLWLSAEGNSTIDGETVADFYRNHIHEKLEKFIKNNNLDYEYHDSGTFLIYI